MKNCLQLRRFVLLLGMLAPICALAQDDGSQSLGALARSLRKSKEPAAPTVIDNDNLSQVMDEVETHRLNGAPLFTMRASSDKFQVSSPDGTCSLSFNAKTASLLKVPYVAEDLPQEELAKLDGPALLDGDTLQVSMYNGSDWNVKEITVSLTIVRAPENVASFYGAAKLLPAAEESVAPTEKKPDLTMLFHLQGSAMPFATTIFREKLASVSVPEPEWHWSIVQARGVPPSPPSPVSN